jgi:hypothetical protein
MLVGAPNILSTTSNVDFSLVATSKFTLSCWAYLQAGTSPFIILSKMGLLGAETGYELAFESTNGLSFHLSGNYTGGDSIAVYTNTFVAAAQTERWVHVLVTYDGSGTAAGIKLYADGKPLQTTVLYDALVGSPGNSSALRFGSSSRAGAFTGVVALARIYRRALSPNEVASLHRRELGITRPAEAVVITPLSNSLTLFMPGHDVVSSGTPLYLHNVTGASGGMNLWVGGKAGDTSAGIDLFLQNDQSGVQNYTTLYIRGSGIGDGGIPTDTWMNLYIERYPAEMITLYLAAPETPLASGHHLFTSGHQTLSSGVSLFTNAIGGASGAMTLTTCGW